jgi:NADPH-dependent curcumin reductase CurA
MARNRGLVFAEIPTGVPVAGQHLTIKEETFDLEAPPPTGGFTGQTLYASFDPYLRQLLVAPDKARDGFTLLPVGSIIPSTVLLRVLNSDTSSFATGDIVVGPAPIQEHKAIEASQLDGFSKVFLGALGMPGLTGYAAIYEIGKPKAGEVLFVSAASGAVAYFLGSKFYLQHPIS